MLSYFCCYNMLYKLKMINLISGQKWISTCKSMIRTSADGKCPNTKAIKYPDYQVCTEIFNQCVG